MIKEYSTPEKEVIGEELAQILMLRVCGKANNKTIYQTAWGEKSAIGVFEVVRRMGNSIERGTIEALLDKRILT